MELGKAQEDFTPIESVANFVFVRTSQAEKIFAYLKSKSIVVRLMGSYLRITAGTGQEVEQVLNSIREYFEVTA